MFFFDLFNVSFGARKSHAHGRSEVKSSVVPTAEFNRFDGQVRPLWKLRCDQLADERNIDFGMLSGHENDLALA